MAGDEQRPLTPLEGAELQVDSLTGADAQGEFLPDGSKSSGCLGVFGTGYRLLAALLAVVLVALAGVLVLSKASDDDKKLSAASTSESSSSSSSSAVTVAPAPVAPAAAPGTTACTQYHVTGTWTIDQGGGYTPTVTLQQTGTNLTGTFTYSDAEAQGANVVSPSNPVTGTLVGDQLVFVAKLAKKDGSSSEGEYKGTVTEAGIANGAARDRSVSGGASVPWTMQGGTFTCISRA